MLILDLILHLTNFMIFQAHAIDIEQKEVVAKKTAASKKNIHLRDAFATQFYFFLSYELVVYLESLEVKRLYISGLLYMYGLLYIRLVECNV